MSETDTDLLLNSSVHKMFLTHISGLKRRCWQDCMFLWILYERIYFLSFFCFCGPDTFFVSQPLAPSLKPEAFHFSDHSSFVTSPFDSEQYLHLSLLRTLGIIYDPPRISRIIYFVVSVFSCPVVSNSLRSLELQHTRPFCPSTSPEVYPSSCSLHQWCHPAISSSDAHFFSCSQSFQASGTFPMGCLFASDDQNSGASASVLPVNTQGWFPLRWTGLISLLSKGLSGVFSSTTVGGHQFFSILPFLQSSSHNCVWTLGRP